MSRQQARRNPAWSIWPNCLVVILSAASVEAQETYSTAWVDQFGGPRMEACSDIVADGAGGAYVCGTTSAPLSAPLTAYNEAFVVHYDSNGAIEWATQLGPAEERKSANGNGLASDGAGNLFLCGITSGDLVQPNAGELDLFVTSLGADGAVRWTRQLGTDGYDNVHDVAADAMGNVFVVGSTQGVLGESNAGNYDALLMTFNHAGDLLWTQQYGTSAYDNAYAVWADGLGNAYVAGRMASDAYLRKFDSTGATVWTRTLDSSKFDAATAVWGDGNGSIYLGGVTDGDLSGYNQGQRDAFLVRYRENGGHWWIQQFGTADMDGVLDVATDADGNVFAAGFTGGDLGAVNQGEYDAFVRQSAPSGDLLWTYQFGTNDHEQTSGIGCDLQGNLYVCGWTRGDLFAANAGGDDAWVVRIVPEPSGFALLGTGAVLLLAFACCRAGTRMHVTRADHAGVSEPQTLLHGMGPDA